MLRSLGVHSDTQDSRNDKVVVLACSASMVVEDFFGHFAIEGEKQRCHHDPLELSVVEWKRHLMRH